MKTVLLKASPRPDGNTATLADHFINGLHAAGCSDVTEFRLNELTLRPCQACNACLKSPYAGCILQDDFMTIFPAFRDADLVVFATPIYWWHVCSQLKTFVDRMHPMLTFDRDHCLTTKHLVLITAYFAEDPYGAGLTVKTFESIAGWAGMGLDVLRYHSAKGHVRNDPNKLAEAHALGASFAAWKKPALRIQCPVTGCRFAFPTLDRLALHLVMAAGDDHLRWKSEYLSAIHTLSNTQALTAETRRVLSHLLPDAG